MDGEGVCGGVKIGAVAGLRFSREAAGGTGGP